MQKTSTLNTICKKPNQSIDNDPVHGIQRSTKKCEKKIEKEQTLICTQTYKK